MFCLILPVAKSPAWSVEGQFRTSPKVVAKNISQRKETLSQKTWLLQKSNCTYTFEQSPSMHNYFGARHIVQLNHLKANSPSISEQLNF